MKQFICYHICKVANLLIFQKMQLFTDSLKVVISQTFSEIYQFIHGLENQGSIQSILGKKGTENFITTYSILFLSVLHQNKGLHDFQKLGQHPTVNRKKVQIIKACHNLIGKYHKYGFLKYKTFDFQLANLQIHNCNTSVYQNYYPINAAIYKLIGQ